MFGFKTSMLGLSITYSYTYMAEYVCNQDRMDLQSRKASDSSDHAVKIAYRLGCLGCGVPTGRKNPRRRKILKIPNSYDS